MFINIILHCVFSAYIPQKQKISFDSIISSSQHDTQHSDIDSLLTIRDHEPSKNTPQTTAAAVIGHKLIGQPRY